MITKVSLQAGSVIFPEGRWEMFFYAVESGKVGIYAKYDTNAQQLLTELEAGKIFGEMGLIESLPRSATAVALTDVELLKVDNEGLAEYFEKEPEKVLEVLRNLTGRLRELSASYVEAVETVGQYLEAEEAKKPSFLSKLKKIIALGEEYARDADYLNTGMDALYYHSGARFM